MKTRTKEEAAAYMKAYRERKSVTPSVTPSPFSVTPTVTPAINVTPNSVTPVKNVTPRTTLNVTPCKGCEDRDMANKILRGRLAAAERDLAEARKLIPKPAASVYKLGPEWQRRDEPLRYRGE